MSQLSPSIPFPPNWFAFQLELLPSHQCPSQPHNFNANDTKHWHRGASPSFLSMKYVCEYNTKILNSCSFDDLFVCTSPHRVVASLNVTSHATHQHPSTSRPPPNLLVTESEIGEHMNSNIYGVDAIPNASGDVCSFCVRYANG